MKIKLTTLLFGLLLAVGWTSNASAQKLPDKSLADDLITIEEIVMEQHSPDAESVDLPMAHSHSAAAHKKIGQRRFGPFRAGQELDLKSVTKAQADSWTYTWTDASNASHTSKFSEVAKNPYQMYELLRQVYMDKRFPGPYYSAYTKNDTRERQVYYGAIEGGWDIGGATLSTSTSAIGDITIGGNNNYAALKSITVSSGNTTLFSWSYAANGYTPRPYGMYTPGGLTYNSSDQWICLPSSLTAFKLYSWLFDGYSSVTVTIVAYNHGSSTASLIVNGNEQTISTYYYNNNRTRTLTWTVNAKSFAHTEYNPETYKPNEEGYTALIVAVKDHPTTTGYHYDNDNDNGYFETKQELIDFLAGAVDSIQLLTDGMRIGKGSDYSIGTMFNCDGTYNKFFFLGKGQARQKPDAVLSQEVARGAKIGNHVPFEEMFEEFSPTTISSGDEIQNFYSLMNEGNVYPVVHDCRSVIELGHQFSMSGNSGEKAYAMTGMNFFIPDYRLKYWSNQYNYKVYNISNGDTIWYHNSFYNVDGRIIDPYQTESTDGNPAINRSLAFTYPRNATNYSRWYAQYNQDYAPRIGLYKITLEAVATAVDYDYNEGNRNYAVTLSWVSSLNEMTGHEVPQIYTVYYWDPVTGEKKYVEAIGITDGKTGLTTITYLVEQFPYSYKLDYIVEGRPADDAHYFMVAVSNVDGVVIPGWNDFVGLQLDHNESDFVVDDMANWYRNFLVVVNEDVANGLTIDQITDPENPMNEFKLYRFEYDENDQPINSKPIATVTFSNPTPEQVDYTVTYDGINQQQQYKPEDNVHKYDLDENHLDVPLTGIVRIKGNGDIVIWPNGFHVNFKSIVIKDNGTVVASWNADEDNTLPNGWYMSSGSKWEEYITTNTGDKVGYVEGGGYIYIPNMLNNSNYTNLTVEIVAYGDGAAVTRIAVNDKTLNIANTTGVTYTWGTNETPLSPAAAPRRDYPNNNNNNSNN